MLISLKVGSFVIDTIYSCECIEMYCDYDENGFENENDDQRELDEKEKIHQLQVGPIRLLNRNVAVKHYTLLPLNYYPQYLEFSTPPPELA